MKEATTKSKLGKNIAFQYGLQAAKYLFPFITLPYLTRVLGPDVYAIRAYVLAAMTFMQVFLDYGFNSYGTRAIAQHVEDFGFIRRENASIMLLRGFLCAIGLVIVLTITPFIPIMLANCVYVVIAYIGVCFKSALPDYIFQGFEDMSIMTKRYVVSQVVATALIFVLVHDANDLLWVPTLEGIASLIAFLWSWENVFIKRNITFCRVSKSYIWKVFQQSTIYFLSSASTTVFTALTTLMIGVLIKDVSQVSYWSISMTAVTAVQSMYGPITNSLYPHMVRRKDFKLLKKLLFIGMCAVLAGTVAFACLSNTIMWILGGNEYLEGSYVLVLVSPVLFFSYPAMLLGFPVLAAVGHVKELTRSSVISACFHIAGLFLLAFVGLFSITNVAILRCCTEALMLSIRIIYVLRYRNENMRMGAQIG